MSVNKYNAETGELVTLASGTRIWIGTKNAHGRAIANGTMPNNCMICIVDDYGATPNMPLYSKTVKATTTPSGNVTSGCNIKSGEVVIAAYSNVDASASTQFTCIPMIDNNTTQRVIYLHCVSMSTMEALANTEVDLTVLYTKFTTVED